MKTRNRANILLVEILIAVLFFMLSCTVLIQVFAAAHNQSVLASVETEALSEAQNVAALVTAGGDVEARLTAYGFRASRGLYSRDYDDFTLLCEREAEETATGTLWHQVVGAYYQKGELLFELPCDRFEEAGK